MRDLHASRSRATPYKETDGNDDYRKSLYIVPYELAEQVISDKLNILKALIFL